MIDSALELAGEGDVSALTLREVARRAGVTHGAPYHHFPNKGALIAAVAEEGFRLLYTEQLQAAGKAGIDPIHRLQALGLSYVKFAIHHPGHFRVMFRADMADWGGSPTLAEAAQLTLLLLTSTVEEIIRKESLELDMMEVTLAAWSMAHGLATLWVDGPLQRSEVSAGAERLEDLADRVIVASTLRLRGAEPTRPRRSRDTRNQR